MHDLQPEGSALFGAEPSFKSDFSLDPEEARAQAASRRASRMQSREASVAPVESLGILYICSVSTEQYIDILHSGRNQGFLSNGCIGGCIYLVKILAHCAMLQCMSRYNKPP